MRGELDGKERMECMDELKWFGEGGGREEKGRESFY